MLAKLSFQLALQGIPLRYNKVMQSRAIASNVKTKSKGQSLRFGYGNLGY